ncbi:MAG: hypothetical protein VB021_09990 [Oscillospiraceae bacterium]|nr:hypothetical protein [Oscillospiraceae bacterium]
MTLYDFYARRFKLTIGYIAFYALILAALNFGIVTILGRYGSYMPFIVADYLSNDMLGVAYVYTIVALGITTLSLFFSPAALRFDAMFSNRWYLLAKYGYPAGSMASCRVALALLSGIGVYLLGLVLTLGVGSLLLFSFSAGSLTLVARLAAIAVMYLLCVLLVPMAMSTVARGKFAVMLIVLAVGAGLFLYMAYEGFFNSAARESLEASIAQLTGFGLPCMALITLILAGGSLALIFANAKKRVQTYEEPELDEQALISLGIGADTLVLERGAHKYEVVISGPEINDEEDVEIDIPRLTREEEDDDAQGGSEDDTRSLSAGEEDPQEELPRKRRGLFGRRRDEEGDDEEEDSEEDEDADQDEDEDEDEQEEERPRKRRGLFGRRRNEDDDEPDEEE